MRRFVKLIPLGYATLTKIIINTIATLESYSDDGTGTTMVTFHIAVVCVCHGVLTTSSRGVALVGLGVEVGVLSKDQGKATRTSDFCLSTGLTT